MTKRSNPMIVRLPFFVAVVTLLKRLLSRHGANIIEPSRDLLLHSTEDLPSPGPDGSAGGAVLVITSDAAFVVSPAEESTVDHCVQRIEDAEIRAAIRAMIDRNETLTTLAPGMVSDADVREARRTVAGWCQLDVKRETALSHVAVSAIQIAERRLGIGF